MNRAEQDPRRPQIFGRHAQAHDLAHRGIAQQVVGNLDCDLHCGLGGAFVSLDIGFVLPVIRAACETTCPFGTVGRGAADVAYPVRGLDIADRPLDFFVPDFLALALAEPPHRHALNICKHSWPWLRARVSCEYWPRTAGNIFPRLKISNQISGSPSCHSLSILKY